jgi:hypothetical protein
MGRRKSVAELQRQLQYAQARANYTRPPREEGSATRRQPKIACQYQSMFDTTQQFTIQASQAAVTFFGGLTALGLADASTDPVPPTAFNPALIKAMIADSSPSVVRAVGSNRPYTRYGKGARNSGSQYTFSAPISADTAAGMRTKFNTVSQAKKSAVGGTYGRIWFEPERFPLVESGA